MDKELEIILTQLGKQMDDNKESFSREMHGGLKAIRAHVDANYELLDKKMDTSIDYQKVTNGRVSQIEEQTTVWRMIQRNPLISFPIGIFLLGVVVALVDIIGIVNIFK